MVNEHEIVVSISLGVFTSNGGLGLDTLGAGLLTAKVLKIDVDEAASAVDSIHPGGQNHICM